MANNEKLAIEEHLVACPSCQNLKLELVEIKTAARELPLHAPPRAIWVRIADVLEEELPASERKTREEFPKETWWERMNARQFTFSLPQLAGAGALALALAISAVYGISGFNTNNLDIKGAQTALLPDEDEIKADLERRIEVINKHKATWNAQARADFEKQLARIEQSLLECRKALSQNPTDLQNQQTLRGLYNEKRQLLESAERSK
jgi:uncharacterized protein YukE